MEVINQNRNINFKYEMFTSVTGMILLSIRQNYYSNITNKLKWYSKKDS